MKFYYLLAFVLLNSQIILSSDAELGKCIYHHDLQGLRNGVNLGLVDVDYEIKWKSGQTTPLLYMAIYMGCFPIVQFLIEKGAESNSKDILDFCIEALEQGKYFIKEVGASEPEQFDVNESQIIDILSFLIERGKFNVNETDDEGANLLMLAENNNWRELAEFLRKNGATIISKICVIS